MNFKKTILLPLLFSVVTPTTVIAGEKYSEEGILLEISFLSKKLLDMKGKDSYTVEQPAYTKAFIGICTDMNQEGVLLTCVTPGTEAEKAGLRTGDIITSINGEAVLGDKTKESKSGYWNIVKNMKEGDVLKMQLIRKDKTLTMDVGVGHLSHPKYTLTIKK